MKIVVVRHAVAEDKSDWGRKNKNDELRPLTRKGKKEFKKSATQIYKMCPDMNAFYSSPLTRAVETAEILKSKYKKKFILCDLLKPEASKLDLLKFLKSLNKKTIFIVGHESFLSEVVGLWVTGKAESIIELKKGGVCVLEDGVILKLR